MIDPNGRYILLELTIQEFPFLLLDLYAPTKIHDQTEFFKEILSILQSVDFDSDCKFVIGGDFNTHLDAVLDNSGGKIETKPSVKYLKDIIMLAFNLIDIWRVRNLGKMFIWRQKSHSSNDELTIGS